MKEVENVGTLSGCYWQLHHSVDVEEPVQQEHQSDT